MPLLERQKKHLRGLAHDLHPVIIVGGSGLHAALLIELEAALEHHELIKVRVNADNRDARNAIIDEICTTAGAEFIQRVGHIAVIYRRNPEKPGILFP